MDTLKEAFFLLVPAFILWGCLDYGMKKFAAWRLKIWTPEYRHAAKIYKKKIPVP